MSYITVSMSRTVTLADLSEALKPLSDAVRCLREEQGMCNTQLSEVYNMVTNISTKMDMIDQRRFEDVPVKKTPAKKTPAKKTPVKTAVESKAENATDTDDAADTEVPETKTPAKKTPAKKTPAKKTATAAVDADADVDNEAETDTKSAADTDADETETLKKTVPKKPAARKQAKAPVKKERVLNKMEFFNKMYDEDETYFDTYLTPKIRKEIAAENSDAWKNSADGKNRILILFFKRLVFGLTYPIMKIQLLQK